MSSSTSRRDVHGFLVEQHGLVGSTQELLRRRLEADPDLSDFVVRAAQQGAGKGRRGTPWSSEPGGSYQSLALKFDGSSSRVESPNDTGAPLATRVDGRLTLAFGVGIAETLAGAGAPVSIKWPNDLMLRGKKLGGIIVEVAAGTIVAGIGINVENRHPDGAVALRGWDVDAVGDMVLEGIRSGLDLLREPPGGLVSRFAALDWLSGRAVSVATKSGVAEGIEPDGRLRLRLADGTFSSVFAGHVMLAET